MFRPENRNILNLYKLRYPQMCTINDESTINLNFLVDNLFINCNEIFHNLHPERDPKPNIIQQGNIVVGNEKKIDLDIEKECYSEKIIRKITNDSINVIEIPFKDMGIERK